ncbi:MAG: hypothetical protein KQI35_03985 [Bacteroidetes bacterium]|nr:hypothetical protein [Bacteroidota bacterium]
MTKFIHLSAILFFSCLTLAQIPDSFNYQAVVRDVDGNLVTDQQIGVQISILEEGAYKLPVYIEEHNVITNTNGLFSVHVGNGTVKSGSFSSIQWGQKTYFIQTALDITGGINFEIIGMSELVSVPYSMVSRGLILSDENGNEYEVTVDASGNLITNQITEFICGENYTDPRDNNVYTTVKLGNQCWMAENLNIGQMINDNAEQGDNDVIEKYCYSNDIAYCDEYGALYQWDEMMQYLNDTANRGVCPEGWRIPTDYDWKVLEGMADTEYDIGDPVWAGTGWRGNNAGGNLKEDGGIHWLSPNTGATNFTSFTVLGTGLHNGTSFSGIKWGSLLYTATESTSTNAFIRNLDKEHAQIGRGEVAKDYALPVRCIKNTTYANSIPGLPGNPNPSNSSSDQPINIVLTWDCNDSDGDPLYYDIYFGTETNPPLVASGILTNSYDPGMLDALETYYWRIVSHDYLEEVSGSVWSFSTEWACGSPITDPYDNKSYNTVEIGAQCWFSKNLNSGIAIISSTEPQENLIIEKYCYEDNPANCDEYGGLYKWGEMMFYTSDPGTQGICPSGWHIPELSEWETLETYLGGQAIAGGKMKEVGFTHWANPNTGATNESGFTGLPGGFCQSSSFLELGSSGFFWSSTPHEINDDVAWFALLYYNNETCLNDAFDIGSFAFSVRCIKD